MMDFKKIPLLQTLSPEQLDYFKKEAMIKEYKKGDVIFSTGDFPKKMYIIYSGFIKIFLDLSDGREQILYIYKKSEFVGGLNILNQDNYLYKSQALRDSVIIEVDRSVFNTLFLNNKEALKVMLDQSYRRIRKSEELVYRLNEINADLKIGKLLIYLIKDYGIVNHDKTILLNLSINREELAAFSGLSRETISRKLNYLEDEGVIELLNKGKILILKPNKLLPDNY